MSTQYNGPPSNDLSLLDVFMLLTLNKNQSPEVFLDLQQVQLLHPSRRPPDPS